MPQLVDPATGTLRDVADTDVAGALASGWHPETTGDVDRLSGIAANELNYGGVSGGIKAGLAGIARGATLGASDVAARVLGSDDSARTLEGLQAQNPYTSGASELAGTLLPSLVTGGAATPAGIAGQIGRSVTAGATRAGAGVLERAGAHAVGAAAEGALYGGGQYLSQTALENKPLSAEGFVGGMGKGALFAAPIGGAFSLGGEALLRARSLFPRSQITTEAAAAVKSDASAALRETITDGDAMAAAARQKIAEADAQVGGAAARTQVTRLAFGGGDPAALGAQVDATATKVQLVDALQKLETSQVALKDWIASGGDAELEASMAGLEGPGVQGRPGVPVGEFGAPGARGIKTPDELQRLAEGSAGDGLAPQLETGTSAGGPRALRGGAVGTPAAPALLDAIGPAAAAETAPAVASLEDIRPASEPQATSVGKRPAAPSIEVPAAAAAGPLEIRRVGKGRDVSFEASMPDGSTRKLADRGEVTDLVNEQLPPGFQHGPLLETHRDLAVEHGLPKDAASIRDNALYVAKPSELADHGISGNDLHPEHTSSMADARAKGVRLEPIEIKVTPDGKYWLEEGNHRLNQAAIGDDPVAIKFKAVSEKFEKQRGTYDISERLRGARVTPATDALGADEAAIAAPDKNPKRAEAAQKAGAASAVRRREIHSAVASNLPPELQLAWDKEGHKFMQEEAARIRGNKDPISAASNISEAFAEKYGSASETGRGYEGDRYHRRLEIEAQHADSWAKEQGRKFNKQAVREEADRVSGQSDQLAQLAKRSGRSIDDVTEMFHERAGIHEFDAGKPRAEAERLALDDVASAMGGAGEHAATDTLTGQLRGMESKLGAGDSLVEMGEPAREAYRTAKAERTSEAAAHFRGKAIADREARAAAVAAGETPNPFHEPVAAGGGAEMDQFFRNLNTPKTRDAYVAANIGRAMREEGSHAAALAKVEREWAERPGAARPAEGHPFEVKRLEMAHDAALERAATAADPAERAAAVQEAQAIEKQITQVGARPGAVEDIAAIAPALTRVEKAAAALTEALGDAAPAAAKEHAAAFRAAEDEASRKTTARIGQAADDAATGRAAAQNRDPLAPPARPADDLLLGPSQKQQRIAAAQKAQREAGAAYAKARVAEAEAQIGAKQAAGAAAAERAKLGPPPEAGASPAGGTGIGHRVVQGAHVVGFAADLASDVGIPGIPRPHDIPVIGPMLSAYLKYRALRAAAGRFMGRVPATAETRAAALAARTRDGIAKAVDRSLGLVERNTNTVRAALTVGTLKATDALSARLVDDGAPDAPAKASVSEQAAVRMREVAAVIANPALVHDAIRAQGRALTDPDLIDALSNHLVAMFQRLNEVAPKGPPPNPFTGKQWTPSPAEAIRFGQQVAIARDPQVAFQMLEAGTLTPTGADTLRKCYALLFRDGQARVIQRATDLKNPPEYSQLIRLGRLFDLPLHPSQDPQHAAVLAGAHTPAAKPAPAAAGGSPPTPSIAGPTTLSNLYQPSGERAQR